MRHMPLKRTTHVGVRCFYGIEHLYVCPPVFLESSGMYSPVLPIWRSSCRTRESYDMIPSDEMRIPCCRRTDVHISLSLAHAESRNLLFFHTWECQPRLLSFVRFWSMLLCSFSSPGWIWCGWYSTCHLQSWTSQDGPRDHWCKCRRFSNWWRWRSNAALNLVAVSLFPVDDLNIEVVKV